MRYDWFKQCSIDQFESVLRFSQTSIRIRIRISFGNWFFFYDQDQDHEQDQDFTMKFIGKSYFLYATDIHQIWCRSAKFLWKSKFCSESGSWYYFGFQYQILLWISYVADTHQILFGSANSFESYCVHMKSTRTFVHPDIQTERRKFFWLVLSSKTYKSWTFVKRREFFFYSCDYNTFCFYILRMWWERKHYFYSRREYK